MTVRQESLDALDAGTSYVDPAELASKPPPYAYDEPSERAVKGPISSTLRVQIAEARGWGRDG